MPIHIFSPPLFILQPLARKKHDIMAKEDMDLYQGITQFDSLYRRAFWKKLTGALKHHQNRLFPIEAWREIAGGEEHYRGIQSVPIRKIIGTENRFQDFDREFLPLTRKDRHRWAQIHNLYTREQSFPPVSLLEIGDFYFVRDGHHRISVAKSQNAEYIDAEIIEIKVPPLPGAHSPVIFSGTKR
ncbi:MAG: hypothetical protein ACUVRN_03535 [Candidatus Caldatribacteriaceae bacterium]